jgi:hypothetical protein
MIKRIVLTINTIVPELMLPPDSLLKIIAIPVTPPIEKLLGNLKKYTPIETSMTPAVINK